MQDIRKVIVLGATGNVGRHVVSALLQASFSVTAGGRTLTSMSDLPPEAVKISVDYGSPESLKQAFSGQDAIIEAFNPNVAVFQEQIVQAAIDAGVRHIITPDFSSDTFNPNVEELSIFEPKLKAQRILESAAEKHGLNWTAIITGPFFDWAIPLGVFWVNGESKEVMVFGSGDQKVSMSAIDMVGRASVAVLKNPVAFLNRAAYFADYTISSNELVTALVSDESDDSREVWSKNEIPLSTFLQQGKEMWAQDTADGVQDRLNSAAYQMLGMYGLFEETNRYGADFSEKIEEGFGIPLEEFQEILQEAVSKYTYA
ncbi:hypothetical protein N7466_008570 [Penicillium verhagenii]|uniref:uncharacterized protein n=1 Tax=Penicillium verhagenii TaxID=1562060 RepID=UPI002545566F|nr:uncharacterized protein N7466_008570 [Penicillium verhagenii]KAJ5924383.1 hypothetical protein N7466_008570 [Penicillium verhagenii]